MTDTDERIRRANAYKLYHEDPAFREPWEQVRAAFAARWQTTTAHETELRETIHKYLGLMNKLDSFVASVIRNGQVEDSKLEAMIRLQNQRDANQLD